MVPMGIWEQVYDEEASVCCLSLGLKEGSSTRSPTPLGGPMLQRAVLCILIASLIFWNCGKEKG